MSTGQGPNAFKKPSSFGSTLKIKPPAKGGSSMAIEKGTHYTSAETADKWKKYNHLGQTRPRENIVDTFGKLMVPPGPFDYQPLIEKRSTHHIDPCWSMSDRIKYRGSVDALNTPGPGTYSYQSCVKPAEAFIVRQEKVKMVKSIEKLGPGAYSVSRSAEMASQRFHRETCALMARRDLGSKTREILDFKTLKIKKNKQQRVKQAGQSGSKPLQQDEKSHLGPGAYFPLDDQPPPSICYSSDSPLPIRKKHDHDPDIPSKIVHTFGVRRPDFALGKDARTPGPGEYDYMASLYGSQPLLEAGGAASRPGKGTGNTTDSEGKVKGQHASLDFATKYIPPLPSMVSTVNINGVTTSGRWVSSREKKAERANAYHSSYATVRKPPPPRRNVGRGTESSVQNLPFTFSGRQSTGAFFQFHD